MSRLLTTDPLERNTVAEKPMVHSKHWSNPWARTAVHRALDRIDSGTLTLVEGGLPRSFGSHVVADCAARIEVDDPAFYRRLLAAGSLGFAESYLRGEWSTPDLTRTLRLLARNFHCRDPLPRWMAIPTDLAARIGHWLRRNTAANSRRNIHEHYDLGNEFFELFLDETMMYSSAVFSRPDQSLGDASRNKLERICRMLRLTPKDHVLEIGTGWGGFAEYAARKFGCRVTSTTISQEQYQFAKDRIDRAGLSDRVELLTQDYRELTGTYDKLVSIEMIEAVGHQFFDVFFQKCGELLRDDGLMALQAITIPDQRFDRYLRSVDFIQKYVFPGGCLPSIGAMQRSIANRTALLPIAQTDFAADYARTLRCWRDRFFNRIDEVRARGFSERFIRLWEYYLSYCEAAFEERLVGVSQLLFAGPECRVDLSVG